MPDQLAIIKQLDDLIEQISAPNEFFREFGNILDNYISYDYLSVVLVNEQPFPNGIKKIATSVFIDSTKEFEKKWIGTSRPIDDTLTSRVIKSKQTAIFTGEDLVRLHTQQADKPVRALMIAPLFNGDIIGTLHLATAQEGIYGDREIVLVDTACKIVGPVIGEIQFISQLNYVEGCITKRMNLMQDRELQGRQAILDKLEEFMVSVNALKESMLR